MVRDATDYCCAVRRLHHMRVLAPSRRVMRVSRRGLSTHPDAGPVLRLMGRSISFVFWPSVVWRLWSPAPHLQRAVSSSSVSSFQTKIHTVWWLCWMHKTRYRWELLPLDRDTEWILKLSEWSQWLCEKLTHGKTLKEHLEECVVNFRDSLVLSVPGRGGCLRTWS